MVGNLIPQLHPLVMTAQTGFKLHHQHKVMPLLYEVFCFLFVHWEEVKMEEVLLFLQYVLVVISL